MCRGEVSRAHATLVASAVRIAECAGLNKDGIEQNWSPITTHVGRMIWHQLCFLDIRAFEAQCPRAIIRKGFFTTRFPLNVDDTELERPNPPQRDAKKWTDMTLSRIRMECNELLREIYFDRERVGPEPDQISVPEILRKVHRFRIQMKKKYMTMIDDSSPVQHYGRLNLELHPRRTYAIVLHPYHMSVTETMPGKTTTTQVETRKTDFESPAPLREAMINAGLETMEIVQEIETSADLRPWSWYKGALQSHHYALLLLVEFFVYPEHPEAERAWRSLEWVFDVPHCIPRAEKGRYVVTRVRDKMDKYVKARRLRCPREMEEKMMVSEQEKSPMPIVSREEDRETLLTGGSRLTGTVSATLTQANTDSSNINFDSYLQTRDTILPAQERFSHQRQVASHNVSGPGDLPMTYDDVPRCVPDSLPKVPNAKTKVFPMNFVRGLLIRRYCANARVRPSSKKSSLRLQSPAATLKAVPPKPWAVHSTSP